MTRYGLVFPSCFQRERRECKKTKMDIISTLTNS